VICDPPYEASLHAAKNSAARRIRTDGGPQLLGLDFAPIDEIRKEFVAAIYGICHGWFIAFCTPEGVAKWADEINLSPMKYKRACVWIKPDSAPQFNGQGPAQGAENFVCAWAGTGYSKWNGGGKRGVYTALTNPSDRHGGHPTEKPWRLFVDILQDFTNPGQTILDPFMGSGTCLLSCQKLGRAGTGIEISPEYFDIACKRVDEAARQPDLFISPAPPKTQQTLDL
jgi:site-specific DNA-methyltransferase (adenine-specific)